MILAVLNGFEEDVNVLFTEKIGTHCISAYAVMFAITKKKHKRNF
jgi:hypothetical protein